MTVIDTKPVSELIIVRNAIVHLGGTPSKQFRKELKSRQSAHAYLLSRPGAPGTLPATHFERLLTGVQTVANQIYTRAWQRPRP